MPGLFKKLKDVFSLKSADAGWDYIEPPPLLSADRKKELDESSSLETPRSTLRAVWGVLGPYWTKSDLEEKIKASALLATTLLMTYLAVDITVDFSFWQNQLINTIQQIGGVATAGRDAAIKDILPNLPLLADTLTHHPGLKEIFEHFPTIQTVVDPSNPGMESLLSNHDAMTSVLAHHDGLKELLVKAPAMQELFSRYPDMNQIMTENPAIKDIVLNYRSLDGALTEYPGLMQAVIDNPDLRTLIMKYPNLQEIAAHYPGLNETDALKEQIGEFSRQLGTTLMDNPKMQELGEKLSKMTIGDFVQNWGQAIDEGTQESFAKAWGQKDLTTLALKYSGETAIGYKAAQILALRWRTWATGSSTNAWLTDHTHNRLKNNFPHIENPDQRFQQDPKEFTDAAVSLMTAVLREGITLAAFGGMLWNISGDFNTASLGAPESLQFDIPGSLFWTAAIFAAAVTAMTYKVGKDLPTINKNRQKNEGYLRSAFKKVYDNSDQIALNDGELVEKELIRQSYTPVARNTMQYIGKQLQLNLVDSTTGNLSIPIPWVAGAGFIALGGASMGTVQQLVYAFNRVTNALSLIVNKFSQLADMKANIDRMYIINQGMELSRYIVEEKKLAAQEDALTLEKGPMP